MKRDSINYFVVGVFVLTLFVGLLFMLYRLTGSTGPADHYYISYENITGVQYGTPVLFEGYQIGQVEQIEPLFNNGDTSYRLTLSVVRGWEISSDSIALIQASGLLSAVAINIQEGEATGILQPGDFIPGKAADNIFVAVNSVAEEIKSLSRESIRPLLATIDDQISMLSRDYRQLANDDIKPLLQNQMTSLLDKLNQSAAGLQQILRPDNQDNFNRILENLATASDDFSTLLEDLDQARSSLESLLTALDHVVVDNDESIRTVIADLKKSMHVIAQHIELVTQNIETSSRHMNEFTRQIRDNPGSLLRNNPPLESPGLD